MQNFFVVGDSHSNFFSGYENLHFLNMRINGQIVDIHTNQSLIQNFKIFHLGAVLAYNLNRYNSKTLGREKIEFLLNNNLIPPKENILCAFGEIDMRVHSIKQARMQNVSFQNVVDSILANYLEFLIPLTKRNNVYVWGAVPTQKDNSPINPEYPYFGTEIERNLATKYFNERLNEHCNKSGIKFLSIFDKLIDENYRTRSEFIADGCHLSQRAWLFAADVFSKAGISINFTEAWLKQVLTHSAQIQAKLNKAIALSQKWGGQ